VNASHFAGPAVLLAAGQHAYRFFALEQMAAAHPLILIDQAPVPWADDVVFDQVVVDLEDRQAVIAAVDALVAKYGRIAGVVTYAEDQIEQAAALALGYGLPGPALNAVASCRDKARMRRVLAERRVPSARFGLAATAQEAADHASRIGYPVVVKPRSLAGSVAVRRCDTPQELAAAYEAAAGARLLPLSGAGGVLVEEYLDGPEVSVECAVTWDGTVHVVAVTRKHLGPEPQFEEVGHSVDGRDPLLADPELCGVVTAAANAIGFTSGVLHAELRLAPAGWSVIELNGRQGGDLIGHLIRLATGINLPRVAVQLATGVAPDLSATHRTSAAVAFHYPGVSGAIEDLHGPSGAHPVWLERQIWLRQAGDRVTTPADGGTLADRLGYTVVTGPDPLTCRERLDIAASGITARIRRPVHTPACVQ
jgi:biotin carboxylase